MSLYNKYNNEINYTSFIGKNVMYLYLTDLKTNNKEIICKIGFSNKIQDRPTGLKRDYKCNFFLLGIINN